MTGGFAQVKTETKRLKLSLRGMGVSGEFQLESNTKIKKLSPY